MKYLRLLPLLLCLCACRAAPPAGFELLAQGQAAGEHDQGAILITSAGEWREFWQRHSAGRIPPAPQPEVDFDVHSVIVVCAGDRPSAGWVLQTTSVTREGERILVQAALHAPAADTLQAQVLTQPFQILLVPRTSGKAELELDQGLSKR